MKIHVTAEDITDGVRYNCTACPIALAVSRASGTEDVFVGAISIKIGHEDWRTPHEAKEFIWNFDRLAPVEPFSFELAASPDYTTGAP